MYQKSGQFQRPPAAKQIENATFISMKRFVILITLCCLALASKAQKTDTVKAPPLPAQGLDPDGGAVAADEEKIYTVVSDQPQFPGGNDSLHRYLDKHMVYPPNLLRQRIGGRVTITFVVEKDGSLSQLKAQVSPDVRFSDEVLQAMRPVKYIPGKQNGDARRVAYSVTVHFDPDYPGFF
jgi:TonB family protein